MVQIGQGQRRFGLCLILERLALTQGSAIALNVLVVNLVNLLELLSRLFTALLRLLLVNVVSRSIRMMPLKPRMAAE